MNAPALKNDNAGAFFLWFVSFNTPGLLDFISSSSVHFIRHPRLSAQANNGCKK